MLLLDVVVLPVNQQEQHQQQQGEDKDEQ